MCSILREMSYLRLGARALHSNAEHRNDLPDLLSRALDRRDRRRSPYRHYAGGAAQPAAPRSRQQPRSRAADSKLDAAIDEAVKGLDTVPRLKKLSPAKKKQLVEFIIGNTLFVLTHELGHGLINEFKCRCWGARRTPRLLAIVTALKMGPAFSEGVLIEAAKGQVFSSKRDKKEGNALAFYDEHGLDAARVQHCLLHGRGRPEKYTKLANYTKLPEYRQKGCAYEYENTDWSREEMLKKNIRGDKPKLDVKVTYEDNKKFAVQEHILRKIGLLEGMSRTDGSFRGQFSGRSRRSHAGTRMPAGDRGS